MQPLERKTTRHSHSRRHVRTQVHAKLGWLKGYPQQTKEGQIHWQVLTDPDKNGAPYTFALLPRHFSRAQRCINQLRADYHEALQWLVGNPVAWDQHLARVFSKIKSATTTTTTIQAFDPEQHLFSDPAWYAASIGGQAKALLKQAPELKPLVVNLSWYYLSQPKAAKAPLKLLLSDPERWQRVLQLGDVPAMQLLGLCVAHPKYTATLLAIYGSGVLLVGELPEDYREQLKKVIDKTPELPPNRCPPLTTNKQAKVSIDWLVWLYRQDAKTVKRACELLAASNLSRLINSYLHWHRRITAFAKQLDFAVQNPYFYSKTAGQDRKKWLESVGRLEVKETDAIEFAEIFRSVSRFASDSVLQPPLCGILRRLSKAKPDARIAFKYMVLAEDFAEDYPHSYGTWLSLLQPFMQSMPDKALSLWLNNPHRYRWNTPDYWCLGRLHSGRHKWQHLLTQWRQLANANIMLDSSANFDWFSHLLALGYTFSQLQYLLPALQKALGSDEWLSDESLTFAHRVDNGCTKDFVAAAKRHQQVFEVDDNWHLEGMRGIVDIWAQYMPRATTLELLQLQPSPTLKLCASQLYFLQLIKHPKLATLGDVLGGLVTNDEETSVASASVHHVDTWISRYPDSLHGVLHELIGLDSQAASTADRVLGKDYPRLEKLEQESLVLEQRIQQVDAPAAAAMQRRLDTLRRRMVASEGVSTQRIANLQQKLEAVVLQIKINRFATAVQRLFIPAWGQLFQLDFVDTGGKHIPSDWPDWLLAPKHIYRLLHIAKLTGHTRRLAIEVIQRRIAADRVNAGRVHADQVHADQANKVTNNPTDFSDALANRRFIAELTAKGIKLEAWLQGVGTLEYTTQDGQPIYLSLETEWLEIINMGGYFNTCLSPGAMNFFSVFANIADINKRVVFARNNEGKIIGRVLLALTHAGGLLAFHPYCHDASIDFQEIVQAFCHELSEATGLIPVPDGEVPRLVARDWYDDGCIDISGQLAALQDGSDFRNALLTVEPTELESLITQAIAPVPLNDLTIPLIANLSECQGRSALVKPLVRLVASCDYLSMETLADTYTLAMRADMADVAYAYLGARLVRAIPHYYQQHGWINDQLIAYIAQVEPSLGLRLLRKTRGEKVRTWRGDTEHRRHIAANIYEALGRPQRAAHIVAN